MKTLRLIIISLIVIPIASYSIEQEYAGAITAQDSLVLALGSDLKTYLHYSGKNDDHLLNEIHETAFRLYQSGVVQTDNGGWLLQPGKLKAHSSYKYADNQSIPSAPECSSPTTNEPKCNLKEMMVDGIGRDVSHFLAKWPIFIRIFMEASYDSVKKERFFRNLLKGIEIQLFDKVIIPPNDKIRIYRLTNYMDGTNGVYRWNYKGKGKNWGYNPSELSCIPFYSSLALIDSDRIRNWYKELDALYPYSKRELELVKSRSCYSGEGRLLAKLSSHLYFDSKNNKISDEEKILFNQYIKDKLLSSKAWGGVNAYKSVVGQRQIILHAAFLNNEQEWQDILKKHFENFVKAVEKDWPNTSRYHKSHQLVFAGRYLALSARFGVHDKIQRDLYRYLYKTIANAWSGDNEKAVSNYGWGEPKFYNYEDWVNWKILSNTDMQ